jgi:hypothetical protein
VVLIAVAAAALVGFAVRAHAHSASKRTAHRASAAAAAAAVAAPTTVGLGTVKVWRGARASLRFRVSYAAATTVTATLVVRDAAGSVVERVALGNMRASGMVRARFVADLRPGTYSCRLLASAAGAGAGTATAAGSGTAATTTTASATPVTLVVRQAFPAPAAIAAATKWLRARTGVTAFAVVDSRGALHGDDAGEQFVTASVVKAMLLVAYLRTYSTLSDSAAATLTQMIEISDNDDAFEMYNILGSQGMYAVADAARMRHFSVATDWTYAEITPADQARFFYEMDRLIPARYDAFARHLLSHVAAYESWGIPAVARPAGWTVFFKGGWRGTVRGQLVHQVARLERHGQTISIAVMTDGDPDMGYGIATIQGVTARLLGVAR